MSLLIVSAAFPPEHITSGRLCYEISEFLYEKNFPFKVITTRPSRPYGFSFDESEKQFRFDHSYMDSYVYPKARIWGRMRESYSMGIKSANYVKKHKKDITFIYANSWPLLAQYILVRKAKKYKIPIVVHVHDVYPESISNRMPFIGPLVNAILLPIDKYTLRNAVKVIAISEKMKRLLIATRNIPDEKISVIPNYQTEKSFLDYKASNEIPEKDGTFTFMYLGTIGPVAGVDDIIEAFYKARLKNCRLVIAGEGSVKEMHQKRVAELNLDNVEFWSVGKGAEDVPKTQAYGDVMLLPVKKGAASSSIPSKLPSYMLSEKPIIAFVDPDSDTARCVVSSDGGWVLPPDSRDDLAEMMKKVAGLPKEELQEKGRKGFEYAMKYLSKGAVLEKLVGIILEEIKSN